MVLHGLFLQASRIGKKKRGPPEDLGARDEHQEKAKVLDLAPHPLHRGRGAPPPLPQSGTGSAGSGYTPLKALDLAFHSTNPNRPGPERKGRAQNETGNRLTRARLPRSLES